MFTRIGIVRFSTACATVLLLLGTAQAQPIFFDQQPADEHSTLVTNGGGRIRDTDFANMMTSLLVSNSAPNARNATFLFNQCFGGGMMDDLWQRFGANVTWVGGAASQHNETSWGQGNAVANAQSFWTTALTPQLANPQQTLIDSINNARANDAVGVNGNPYLETGQSFYANGGQNILLNDPNAASRHAILWAGLTNADRHFNNIQSIIDSIGNGWGAPNGTTVTVDILFGDGIHAPDGSPLPGVWNAQAATAANLQQVINRLTDGNAVNGEMGPSQQFFFYATDHGGRQFDQLLGPRVINPGDTDSEVMSLSLADLEQMLRANDNSPALLIDYEDLLAAVPVFFNGNLLGMLDPNAQSAEFFIQESWLTTTNNIEISNTTLSTFTLNAKIFDTGAIEESVPEPDTLALVALGGLWVLVLGARWNVRRAARPALV